MLTYVSSLDTTPQGEGASEPSDLTAVLKAVMGGALGTDLGGQVRGDKKKADKMKEGLKAERRAAKDELKAHKRWVEKHQLCVHPRQNSTV